jgi:hypothetical protein
MLGPRRGAAHEGRPTVAGRVAGRQNDEESWTVNVRRFGKR